MALQQKPQETQQLWMGVFGTGAQLGFILPYSRVQETEADHFGLIFMAMAGYNPNTAIDFRQRMSASQQGQKVPEYMSTHPFDETRISKIKKEIPEAMKY